jgi:hypothetical protein
MRLGADDLWFAWVDTDRRLHLARSMDAVTFQDWITPVVVAGSPALGGMNEPTGAAAIAVAGRKGQKTDGRNERPLEFFFSY